jgi:hypothetical protein
MTSSQTQTQIQTLSNNFNSLMTEYQNIYTGFINSINANDKKNSKNNVINTSNQLQKLNQQLMDINKEINNNINQSNGEYQNNLGVINEREEALQQNYVVLIQDRNYIGRMVKDFGILSSAQENGNINVTTNYYNYILLLFIVILLLFLLLRFSIPEQQSGGKTKNFLSKMFN